MALSGCSGKSNAASTVETTVPVSNEATVETQPESSVETTAPNVAETGKAEENTTQEVSETVTEEITTQVVEEETEDDTLGPNIFLNSDFVFDAKNWDIASGASTVSNAKSDTNIYKNVSTYGVIDRDPGVSAPYDCFAQDITASVENGSTYSFEFYAMLSEDYAAAPKEQRLVEFAPYITVDGNTEYLGSYSSVITGKSSQTLEAGVWTKYEGTFKIDCVKDPDQVVVRIIEQGTEYGQGECVLGDYCVTGLSMRKLDYSKDENYGIEENIPNLRDFVASADGIGVNAIIGTGITGFELSDELIYQLVTKHFNAITLGNELKPDCIFSYSNGKCPGTHEEEFNGSTITVPNMSFSSSEKMLDKILDWNNNNPDKMIRVRGHVLVWHAQTPEWFFHVDYDPNNDYVSVDEMNVRLEWYIKSMFEHFVGEDSKYKELFYGWDVVNEAISDGSGSYRTDKENASEPLSKDTHGSNSSWWHIYQSNEYIINAFKFANKYAPESLELYYNDYGECSGQKVKGICELLTAVKEAEGPKGVGTRISAMGMQGHYNATYPSKDQFETAIRSYAEIVGKVQITEFDIKASGTYDGTEKTETKEFIRMGHQYKTLYNIAKQLDAEDGIDVTGITFWGVVDKYSWLQSSSNVGGASDGKNKQCPLLFDDYYHAKPAFWAFVDPGRIPLDY